MLAKFSIALVPLFFVVNAAHAETEKWKGTPPTSELGFAALAGMSVIDGTVGFGANAYVSKKIVHQGFSHEINNQVFIEGMVGPWILRNSNHIAFGAHLRWDFNMDEDWTFYAIGGLGGFITTSPRPVVVGGGGGGEVYPRFGIGAVAQLASGLGIRVEVSHDFLGGGVAFGI